MFRGKQQCLAVRGELFPTIVQIDKAFGKDLEYIEPCISSCFQANSIS
jgi:hypothetical protein